MNTTGSPGQRQLLGSILGQQEQQRSQNQQAQHQLSTQERQQLLSAELLLAGRKHMENERDRLLRQQEQQEQQQQQQQQQQHRAILEQQQQRLGLMREQALLDAAAGRALPSLQQQQASLSTLIPASLPSWMSQNRTSPAVPGSASSSALDLARRTQLLGGGLRGPAPAGAADAPAAAGRAQPSTLEEALLFGDLQKAQNALLLEASARNALSSGSSSAQGALREGTPSSSSGAGAGGTSSGLPAHLHALQHAAATSSDVSDRLLAMGGGGGSRGAGGSGGLLGGAGTATMNTAASAADPSSLLLGQNVIHPSLLYGTAAALQLDPFKRASLLQQHLDQLTMGNSSNGGKRKQPGDGISKDGIFASSEEENLKDSVTWKKRRVSSLGFKDNSFPLPSLPPKEDDVASTGTGESKKAESTTDKSASNSTASNVSAWENPKLTSYHELWASLDKSFPSKASVQEEFFRRRLQRGNIPLSGRTNSVRIAVQERHKHRKGKR